MKHCQVCEGSRNSFLFFEKGYEFRKCSNCGHIFVQPDMLPESMVEFYDENFFAGGPYAAYVKDRETLERNFRRFIRYLLGYKKGGTLLEIGCAVGFFLELAREHWQVTGIDVSEHAVQYARKVLSRDVVCGDFMDVLFDDYSFDVVTMWDTIEHLKYPDLYISKVARLLKPGGILALTTGDAGSLNARLRGRRWRLVSLSPALLYSPDDRETPGTPWVQSSRDPVSGVLPQLGCDPAQASRLEQGEGVPGDLRICSAVGHYKLLRVPESV